MSASAGPRIEELPERSVAVLAHPGTLADLDRTRRLLYQDLIQQEAVGGPSMVRFDEAEERIDILVQAAPGYHGAGSIGVETLEAGPHAVLDYEGPEAGIAEAKEKLRRWAEAQGHEAAGRMIQVHLMDTIEDETEQQLQLPLRLRS